MGEFDYINKTYGLRLQGGEVVKFSDCLHTVDGVSGPHLKLRCHSSGLVRRCHPRWKMEYLPEQEALPDKESNRENLTNENKE